MRSWLLCAIVAALAFAVARCELAPPTPPAPAPDATTTRVAEPATALTAAPTTEPARPAAATATADTATQRVTAELALRVRAIDGAGNPVAGAAIWCELERRAADGSVAGGTQMLPATAADGSTQLPDATQQLTAPGVIGVTLVARVAGADGPVVRLDPRALPNGIVDVEVPPHGRIVAELRGPQGEPWDLTHGGELFHLAALGSDGRPENREFLATPRRGRIEYERVAVGRRFRLWPADDWLAPNVFDGPAQHGATVVVPLAVPAKLRVVTGHLLGPDGAPWRRPARLTIEAGSRSSHGDLRTDDEGMFVAFVPGHVGARPRFLFEAAHAAGPLEALLTLASDLPPGLHRLGDATLREPPVLVAGRLVWTPFAPADPSFAGVQMEIEHSTSGDDGIWLGFRRPFTPAADGSFVQRGHAGHDRYRLVFAGSGPPRDPLVFAAGTTDLRIELAPPARVVATFLLDTGPAGDGWRIELVPLQGTRPRPRRLDGPLGPGGPFGGPDHGDVTARRDGDRLVATFEGLAAGSYSLRATRGAATQPAFTRRVDVAAGATVDGAAVRDIDLRGR